MTAIEDCRKILIVEDTVASGESIQSVKQRIAESGQDCEFLYFAAYIEPGKEQLVDMFLEIIPQPRMFEWNIFHHSIIENSCIDIDGVLCIDPSKEENDDGKNYLNFIRTACPKFIPSHRINSIVSSRLEEYRTETEEWLANNGIEYENLYLLNATAEDRRTKGLHALFKAKVYGASDCSLFIESNLTQAEQIRRITGKPVYCVENNHLYDGSDIYKITNETIYSKIGPLYRLLSRNRVLKKIFRYRL